MVLSQKDNQEAKGKVPIQAEMVTKEELMAMEYHNVYGETEVDKCYGGFFANLGHGCLRWHVLLFSKKIHETEDAICGKGSMRVRTGPVPWGP